MKIPKQGLWSIGIILAAVSVVVIQSLGDEPAVETTAASGHDHAAMGASGEQMPVRLSAEDARRIGVTFSTVESKGLEAGIRTLGTVVYDETRLTTVSPKIEGWVERLHVDFTGAPIQEGQRLMSVYSPGLVTAQEELVLAVRLRDNASEGRALENATALLESARRRLSYWDVPDDEIERIEQTGEITKTLTLRSPATGTVIEKFVVEGDRIMPGMTTYRIADLSHVWIEADVFEKDLGLVEVGLNAVATFESFPGRRFSARITYIYPTVSMETRTGRMRLELANPGLILKPGMYADIAVTGRPSTPTLVVPRSAVLQTGQRALAFVQAADGTLTPREVTTGRTAGREIEILDGLVEGERVVSSAAFLVDAESNLGSLTAGMREMPGVPDTGAAPETEDHSGHDMGSTN